MGRRGCASAMGMIKFPSSCSSPKALCNQFIDYYICSRGVFCINHIKLRNFVVITIECSIATVDRGSIIYTDLVGLHDILVQPAHIILITIQQGIFSHRQVNYKDKCMPMRAVIKVINPKHDLHRRVWYSPFIHSLQNMNSGAWYSG